MRGGALQNGCTCNGSGVAITLCSADLNRHVQFSSFDVHVQCMASVPASPVPGIGHESPELRRRKGMHEMLHTVCEEPRKWTRARDAPGLGIKRAGEGRVGPRNKLSGNAPGMANEVGGSGWDASGPVTKSTESGNSEQLAQRVVRY